MKTKNFIDEANERLRAAEEALAQAKAAHREAFRIACTALFNEFGLKIESFGYESIVINEVACGAYRIEDLPERT